MMLCDCLVMCACVWLCANMSDDVWFLWFCVICCVYVLRRVTICNDVSFCVIVWLSVARCDNVWLCGVVRHYNGLCVTG